MVSYYQFTTGWESRFYLNLKPGEIYDFMAYGISGLHPFKIGESYGDTSSSLVTGEALAGDLDELILSIPSDFDGELYYFCTEHSGMISPFSFQNRI